jgi:hypothetical protein
MATIASPATDLHHAYVEAINSNDTDRIIALTSGDVVFQVQGEPELIGKAAARGWAEGFFAGFAAHWDKTQHAFEQSGDLAVRRLEAGEGLLSLLGPDIWGPMPGLLTGVNLAPDGTVYVSGLGNALVRLEPGTADASN